MSTLFIRTLIVYTLMFAVLRLMGKRQINEMQPFDLAVTLLIANLASIPMSEPAVPLFYGVVPIIGLFIVQKLVAHASLKSERIRRLVCGSPLIVIEKGVLREDVMRSANYSLSDLCEQLRLKDVFSLSEVEYAILETNGSLSVLLKGEHQQPTNRDLKLQAKAAKPDSMLVADGKFDETAAKEARISREKLEKILKGRGIAALSDCLFASLDSNGMLLIQTKLGNGKRGAGVKTVNYDTVKNKYGG
ncbi:MAG: DUF421 domain-containing protein [Clostridia bacterium]|nr:DUF421 domain-containing protein [Clostridia bacterium]